MYAHCIEILDGAHDDAVASAIAHDLHLVLFPPLDALFNQHLAGGRQLQALRNDGYELFRRVGYAAASAAERVRRAKHNRIPQIGNDLLSVLYRIRVARARRFDAKLCHTFVEHLAIFATLNCLEIASDHLNAVLVENARFG